MPVFRKQSVKRKMRTHFVMNADAARKQAEAQA